MLAAEGLPRRLAPFLVGVLVATEGTLSVARRAGLTTLLLAARDVAGALALLTLPLGRPRGRPEGLGVFFSESGFLGRPRPRLVGVLTTPFSEGLSTSGFFSAAAAASSAATSSLVRAMAAARRGSRGCVGEAGAAARDVCGLLLALLLLK